MTAPERPEYRVEWCARCPCGTPGARWQSSPDHVGGSAGAVHDHLPGRVRCRRDSGESGVSEHELVTDAWEPDVKSRCTCGEWTAKTPRAEHRAGMHTREHKIHAEAARAGVDRLARNTARDWYERTGHCHGCGQPGNWCQCGTYNACGCRDLHPMGSGIHVDPLDMFADQPISLDQGELFG